MVVRYVQCPDSEVLIYRHEKRRKRPKSDVVNSIINRNCHRNGHYMNDFKCYSYILIYIFIVATIMMLSLPTTIAMNQNQIENNENAINDVQPIIQMSQPNNHHARNIDKNYRPVDTESLYSIGMGSLLSLPLKKELTTNRENVNQLRPTEEMIRTICNCSDGKMLPIQMVNCMQICAKHSKPKMSRITNDQHNNEHKNEIENGNKKMHDLATKQKRYDESVAIKESAQWQSDNSINRIQSGGMSENYSKHPFKLTTIQNDGQKSVNSINGSGININNDKFDTNTTTMVTATAETTTTRLNEHFYPAKHQIMVLKNVSINQTKRRTNQDGAHENENEDENQKMNFDPTIALNDDDPNDFNYKLNIKRETRTVKMQPNQIQPSNEMQEKNLNKTEMMTMMMEMMKNVRFPEDNHEPTSSSPETKVPFPRKQAMNKFFDSTESQGGGVTESNGPIFDANRTTVSIISSK